MQGNRCTAAHRAEGRACRRTVSAKRPTAARASAVGPQQRRTLLPAALPFPPRLPNSGGMRLPEISLTSSLQLPAEPARWSQSSLACGCNVVIWRNLQQPAPNQACSRFYCLLCQVWVQRSALTAIYILGRVGRCGRAWAARSNYQPSRRQTRPVRLRSNTPSTKRLLRPLSQCCLPTKHGPRQMDCRMDGMGR